MGQNSERQTPSHLVLIWGQEVARELIGRSADAMTEGNDGQTLLHLASIRGPV